ncbi:MAG TPA: class I SAM-dependent methyltransferase [Chthoniobacteraceae bacterium]|jgi:tRNA (cmo5U34)-methyltransferase|nr:Methyltransferase type 12 [Chthoniobacter sp.]HEV7867954.1 class I SAM-dependent methyltransferase [Chthoniobacteraceae bacterium]
MSTTDSAAIWRSPEAIAQFLQSVRASIPLTIEQIDMMLRLVTAARGTRVERFLDLGCGEGMLSAALLEEHPNSEAWLVDFSSSLLHGARRRLQSRGEAVHFIEADFSHAKWTHSVAAGAPFDVVVSALSMHHLPDDRKRALYAEVFDLLKPEGIFINIEHVSSATRWTESIWNDYMIDSIFGETIKAAPGKTRAEVAREYYAQAREVAQPLAPLEVHCDWLREIGFESVDCYLKILELAVFGGQRPRVSLPGE